MLLAGAALLVAISGGGHSPKLLDGESAAKLAADFARHEGVKGALTLVGAREQSQGERWGYSAPSFWSLNFKMAGKRGLKVDLSPIGNVLLFQINPMPVIHSNARQLDKGTIEKTAWEMLKAAHPSEPLMLESAAISSDNEIIALFKVKVNGIPFININPTYGYHVQFDAMTRQLVFFLGHPKIPPVNAKHPLVGQEKAMAQLRSFAKTTKSSAGTELLNPFPPLRKSRLKPVLGYYNFKSDSSARLVWRGRVFMSLGRGQESDCGYIGRCVDALTGRLLKPDDQGEFVP